MGDERHCRRAFTAEPELSENMDDVLLPMNTIAEIIQRAAQFRRDRMLTDSRQEWAHAIEQSRQQSDTQSLIQALKGLAETERASGRNREALAPYEEAVTLCRKQDDPLLLAHTIRHLGDVRRHLGLHEGAVTCYEEALDIYRKEKEADSLDVANALRPFAIVKEGMGDFEGARIFWREARELYKSRGIDAGVAEASKALDRIGGL
jgi:tetratricopeptide (TPR) repeat protein